MSRTTVLKLLLFVVAGLGASLCGWALRRFSMIDPSIVYISQGFIGGALWQALFNATTPKGDTDHER